MAIIEGITAAKAALDVGKTIMDMVNRPDINPADVRGKVNELLIHLVNTQLALGDAHVENSDLRHQLDQRKELKALEDDMDFRIDGGFYVRKSEFTKGLIAYCPICWKKDHITVPLEVFNDPNSSFRCSIHQTIYETEAYRRRAKDSWGLSERNPGPDDWMR